MPVTYSLKPTQAHSLLFCIFIKPSSSTNLVIIAQSQFNISTIQLFDDSILFLYVLDFLLCINGALNVYDRKRKRITWKVRKTWKVKSEQIREELWKETMWRVNSEWSKVFRRNIFYINLHIEQIFVE